MLHSLHLPTLSYYPFSSHSSSRYIKFQTTYRDNVRYLKTLTIIDPKTKPDNLPLPDAVNHVITTVNFFKSKSFTEQDFPRLQSLCPQLFSNFVDPTHISPTFDFLNVDVLASVEQSRALVMLCPKLLLSDVELCLKPTLQFLKQVGVENLNVPTNQNAHLLNTRVEKMRPKMRFLQERGFSYAEAANACKRLPAILGYGVESNLEPKFEYLVNEMQRDLVELKKFPQYFGFSLEKRIVPRHLHLKERGVRIPLNRMLMWGDDKFYAKWK
ncbi:hypothetical protein TanjilG_10193 [Lupinus angustifolius]|uniref:Uncharacterized protein n=1 Tax=Lupinus angustifolius TaxID=3871 RepID=A0A4P1RBU8_LUPAN|nr:PREDICTED: transcription termination factor MTEF1, chloroplastic [Lupinus angustifolius]OIW07358.1 hypothetical protein TanjilG_10193 [Lupinus angustifolius]